ncbi:hypothetical protein [Burkholderia cenocepacia]|uniref:Uncharacterized protein n=1 Tax=Burkholderia cenocepacia TaxID=95486 RepID=A0A3R9CWP2_9BURK|nr:hypothetical protein [Burkholderia cenocepacia]RSC15094.1 hypothetical protein EGT41_16315 [Burkholderia cenocepacia]UJH72593.1 hypothetical protein L0U95_12375 [Burkholderia cenocepacia]
MQEEQFLIRDRAYGVWHRTRSISRFIGTREARALTMADLDSVLFVEFGCSNKVPLALVEVARDIGQEKASGVIHQLARMAGLPAFVALYSPASRANPASPAWHDIEEFRVRRVWPKPEKRWRRLSPAEWAEALVQIRDWQLKRFSSQHAANDPAY